MAEEHAETHQHRYTNVNTCARVKKKGSAWDVRKNPDKGSTHATTRRNRHMKYICKQARSVSLHAIIHARDKRPFYWSTTAKKIRMHSQSMLILEAKTIWKTIFTQWEHRGVRHVWWYDKHDMRREKKRSQVSVTSSHSDAKRQKTFHWAPIRLRSLTSVHHGCTLLPSGPPRSTEFHTPEDPEANLRSSRRNDVTHCLCRRSVCADLIEQDLFWSEFPVGTKIMSRAEKRSEI